MYVTVHTLKIHTISVFINRHSTQLANDTKSIV